MPFVRKRPLVHLFACACLLLAAVPAFGQASRDEPARRKPNVVIILVDDLGYADVGYHNLSKDVRTPRIDALAASGVQFSNAYVSSPVCSPCRAGLMTGRYQQRFGYEQNPLGPEQEEVFGLPDDELTLAQAMGRAGYATGVIGKWHLGRAPGMWPLDRGFDEFFGFLGGMHGFFNNEQPSDHFNAIRRGREPVGVDGYLTDAFSNEAVNFIERHADEPFFLYLSYNAPHTPMEATPADESAFDSPRPKRKTFLGMMAAVDRGVGQVLDTLESKGLRDDTLVVFLSDNGGPTTSNTSRNRPFSGAKGSTFEGGVRVPFLMSWPGRLPAGEVDDRVVMQLDLFPTSVAAADAEVPDNLDGKNLLPYLASGNDETIHERIFWRFGPRRGMRQGSLKLQWNGDEEPGLYDVAADPAEGNDLSEQMPDKKEEMLEAYGQWQSEMSEPAWEGRLEGDGQRDAGMKRRNADR